jgi:hypothetical protein
VHAIAVLLAILVGLLFGLLAWGLLRMRSHSDGRYGAGEASIVVRDGVLLGLLVLAAFALGVLVSYMVIVIG